MQTKQEKVQTDKQMSVQTAQKTLQSGRGRTGGRGRGYSRGGRGTDYSTSAQPEQFKQSRPAPDSHFLILLHFQSSPDSARVLPTRVVVVLTQQQQRGREGEGKEIFNFTLDFLVPPSRPFPSSTSCSGGSVCDCLHASRGRRIKCNSKILKHSATSWRTTQQGGWQARRA